MKRRYTKNDVKTHGDRSIGYPAVNVKMHSMHAFNVEIADEFKCSLETAEKAVEFAIDSEQQNFWEYWTDKTGDLENGLYGSPEYAYFPGHSVDVNQGGRSGGWLEVDGLPPISEWDAVMLMRWRKFELAVLGAVASHCSWEAISEVIEANEWANDGAEAYNHVDTKAGVRALHDLHAAVAEVERRFYAGEDFDIATIIVEANKAGFNEAAESMGYSGRE